ncbi:MAG: DUF167 family protein [Acidobacteriota bacterium]|nr:DUF167 family protein [Acidobacteriota bacterium]
MAFLVRETKEGAQFAVRVQPRASRNKIAGLMGDAIKLAITAPPVDGKANEAVVEFFAEMFGVSKSSVTIVSGETGRNKVIAVRGVKAEAVRAALGV